IVFFFQAEDGIRDRTVTGVQTCALPISNRSKWLIRNVASSTIPQPSAYNAFSSSFPAAFSTFHTTPPIGCHSKNISSTAAQLNRSEEHTSELQSPYDLVCRLLLEKKKT